MHLGQFARWNVIVWFATLIVVLGLELIGIWVQNFLTLTELIQMYIPLWLRAIIIGWLAWHFLVQYK